VSRLLSVLKKIAIAAIPAALVMCAGKPDTIAVKTPELPQLSSEPISILDYKGKVDGEEMPEWISLYLESGVRGVETLEIYSDFYVFVSRSEGFNLNALSHWLEGFSPELDFPRMAAARIESRFLSVTRLPDDTYGSFFEAIIRAASDAPWTGAVREDDFWILKRTDLDEKGIYEYFILVTIMKTVFTLQLDAVFLNLRPYPPPTRDQIAAANRVKERFFDGF
jgi:hypothetical protein